MMIHRSQPSARFLRRRPLTPRPEMLEARQLLTAGTSIVPFYGLARVGHNAFFQLGYSNTNYLDHVSAKTVNWGDGSPTEVIDPTQYYGLSGRHTYAATGNYHATISETVQSPGQADYVVTADAPIDIVSQIFEASSQGPIYVRTGASTSPVTPVAITTDIDSALTVLQSTIDWGDGTGTHPATLQRDPVFEVGDHYSPSWDVGYNGGIGILVQNDHAFSAAGNYSAHVVITGPGVSKTLDVPIVVSDSSVYAHPATDVTGNTGKTQGYALGTVEDLDRQVGWFTAVPFKATVDWGDGSPVALVSPSTIFAGIFLSSNHYTISYAGSHKYLAPGDYLATLTVTGADGTSSTTQTPIRIATEVYTITAAGAIGATQGESQNFVVGTGFDSVDNRSLSRFQGSISWGDGSVTDLGGGAGGITDFLKTDDGGITFKVVAPHTYATAGSYRVTLILRGDADVVDGPILAGGGIDDVTVHAFDAQAGSTTGVVGTPIGGNQLATVTVPGQNAVPGDYTAKVDWGDGSAVEDGAISSTQLANDPRIAVIIGGSHAYGASGSYHFSITITTASGDTRIVTGTAVIDDVKFSVSTTPFVPKGQYVTVAPFGHPDSAKKVWKPITTKAAHPGHRKPLHHKVGTTARTTKAGSH